MTSSFTGRAFLICTRRRCASRPPPARTRWRRRGTPVRNGDPAHEHGLSSRIAASAILDSVRRLLEQARKVREPHLQAGPVA